jgi:hypothetical protein
MEVAGRRQGRRQGVQRLRFQQQSRKSKNSAMGRESVGSLSCFQDFRSVKGAANVAGDG